MAAEIAERSRYGGRAVVGLALVTALAVAVNAWIAANRMSGFSYETAPYASIYIPAEAPVVKDMQRTGPSRISVTIDAPAGNARKVELEAPPGLSQYEVGPPGATPSRLHVFNDGGGSITVGSPELLFVDAKRLPLRTLVADVADYDAQHVVDARALIAPLELHRIERTSERLRKLWEFLHARLASRAGTPPPDFARRSPWEQYQRTVAGETEMHCANFSEVLVFFATIAGIPSRVVDVVGRRDGVQLGAHAFVEVYLAEERRWMYTDLTLQLLQVASSSEGPPLNAIELVHRIHAGAERSLVATLHRDGRLAQIPFGDIRPSPSTLIHPNALFVFHRDYGNRRALLSAAWRYFVDPEPAYGLAFDDGRAAIKRAAFYALLALVAAWIGVGVSWLKGRAAPPRS